MAFTDGQLAVAKKLGSFNPLHFEAIVERLDAAERMCNEWGNKPPLEISLEELNNAYEAWKKSKGDA